MGEWDGYLPFEQEQQKQRERDAYQERMRPGYKRPESKSETANARYRSGWDRVFGKKDKR